MPFSSPTFLPLRESTTSPTAPTITTQARNGQKGPLTTNLYPPSPELVRVLDSASSTTSTTWPAGCWKRPCRSLHPLRESTTSPTAPTITTQARNGQKGPLTTNLYPETYIGTSTTWPAGCWKRPCRSLHLRRLAPDVGFGVQVRSGQKGPLTTNLYPETYIGSEST
jgi:predicted small lipoprotein YifL